MRVPFILAFSVLLAFAYTDCAIAQVTAAQRLSHRLGGQEPLPPVPQRNRLPAPGRGKPRRRRARRRAPAGARHRRLRLGQGRARQPLRRWLRESCSTPASATACARTTLRRSDHRVGVLVSGNAPPGAVLRLDLRRRRSRRCGRSTCRARRRSSCACPMHRATVATVDMPLGDGTAQRVVRGARGPRRAHRRHRRFDRGRRRQSGQGGDARRRLLLQALPRRRPPVNISVQGGPATAATAPARTHRRVRPRRQTGRATRRAG